MEVYGHPAVGMACEENTLGFVVLTTTGQFYDGCFWVQGRVTQGDSRLAETGRPIKTHQLNLYRIEYLVGNPLFLIELKQLGPIETGNPRYRRFSGLVFCGGGSLII